MSVLFLREDDVRRLVTMPIALEVIEAAFRSQAAGTAVNQSRRRLLAKPSVFLHYMAAADTEKDYLGMKIYTSGPQGTQFLVPLFRASTGQLLALIEADYLGQLRTGAASGVATRYLARPDASQVGIIGTGLQARTQLEAICLVRGVSLIRAYSRDPVRRSVFVKEMSDRLGVTVEPALSPQAAVEDADIIITATSAKEPVVHGAWLKPGVHINAIGANMARRRELDEEAVSRADFIATDFKEQAQEEAGDLIQAFVNTPDRWDLVRELCQVVSARCAGRRSETDITIFKSNGIAIWDVALAGCVRELAEKHTVGTNLPLFRS